MAQTKEHDKSAGDNNDDKYVSQSLVSFMLPSLFFFTQFLGPEGVSAEMG